MKHQKRLSAPKHYPVERKNGKYVISGKGPHSEEEGIPAVVFLRDVLGYAESTKEVTKILEERNVTVNGKTITEPGYTIGFMDTISLDKVDKDYRVVVDNNGLVFKEIDDSEKRVYKVVDKTTLKGGKTQLNLDAGENMIPEEDGFSTKSSIIYDLEEDEILETIEFKEGNIVYISGGSHVGETAVIKEKVELPGSQANKVLLEKDDGTEFETIEDYTFVIGTEEPEVEI